MEPFQYRAGGRVIFGPGAIEQVGAAVAELDGRRVLLVTDPGIVASGLVDPVVENATAAGAEVVQFDGVEANPTTRNVEAGRDFARAQSEVIDLILALGGGSAMDCAKGINFLLTNGGSMQDYWGLDKASKPMLPSVGIPTTAGTGSEAQSYALIRQHAGNRKMACGDRKARFATVILDPNALATVPGPVAAATGLDAVAHALETYVARNRNVMSQMFSREAWRLLEDNLEPYLADPGAGPPREAMMLGAFLAGQAIEFSMLGGAHAAANPLTANFEVDHGSAVALMLPHVIRFNGAQQADRYLGLGGFAEGEELAKRVERLRAAAGLPSRLREVGVDRASLDLLSRAAVEEWTGGFNPRPLEETDFGNLYDAAY